MLSSGTSDRGLATGTSHRGLASITTARAASGRTEETIYVLEAPVEDDNEIHGCGFLLLEIKKDKKKIKKEGGMDEFALKRRLQN
jgi:hypothetical protein